MASSLLFSPSFFGNPIPISVRTRTPSCTTRIIILQASKQTTDVSSQNPTRLLTFLGKGGSGKTTSAVFAAQHFALSGLRTCLVLQNQDPTPEYLLDCKIGNSPVECSHNLAAVRLETTQMLLEPLKRLKQADSRLNMTQGVLEGVGCWRRACSTSRNGFYLFDTSTREIRWVLRYYGPKGPESSLLKHWPQIDGFVKPPKLLKFYLF